MDVKKLEHLNEMLCEDLGELSDKGAVSSSDLDYVFKYTTSINNLDKIIRAKKYSNQESHDGGSYRRGSYGNESYRGSYGDSYGSYDDGSYDGRSYDNGSYDGGSYRRMRGSYADEKEMIADKIQTMMNGNMNQNDKMILQKAMSIIRG